MLLMADLAGASPANLLKLNWLEGAVEVGWVRLIA